MLNKCEFHNANNTNVFAFNTDTSPLNGFDVTGVTRISTERNKPQRHGVNPTFPYRGGMEIHIEGAIFKDTTDNYVAYRKTLALALFGNPNATAAVTNRKNGTLIINVDGETEDWETDCVVTAYSNPIKGLYPTLSEFLITFFSWTPWFTGVNTSNLYYWS